MNATPEHLRQMIARADEKLRIADVLLGEQAWNDASSRAYYAAFHAISALLASKGMSFSSHGATLGAFNKEFVRSDVFPREFATFLTRLFQDRQRGDYDFLDVVDESTARTDVADARKIVDACVRYLEDSTGSRLRS